MISYQMLNSLCQMVLLKYQKCLDFVTKQISGMSTAKARGLDDISVKLLKLTSDAIVDILICVLNFSIEMNNFEND